LEKTFIISLNSIYYAIAICGAERMVLGNMHNIHAISPFDIMFAVQAKKE
jgi:hypothetical protein